MKKYLVITKSKKTNVKPIECESIEEAGRIKKLMEFITQRKCEIKKIENEAI
jgi:hypothetical protein